MREGKGMQRIWKTIAGAVFLSAAMVLGTAPVSAEAATAAQKEGAKQEMLDIFYSADTGVRSMLGYSLTVDEFTELYENLKRGEHERMLGTYGPYTYLRHYWLGSRVTAIKLMTEDTGVLERYQRVNENADAILAGIEPEMDNLDKVIYLHDSIVESVTYNKTGGNQRYSLGGALGDKNAVCLGYAEALNLLLKESGFETDCVISDSVNHAWSYVKLDGEWYHLDATWDDATTNEGKEITSRRFLLRNDDEFINDPITHGADMACEYGAPASVSTKYSNWFMHDVVGKIAFEDGVWYFTDPATKSIARADADGSGYEIVVKYAGQSLSVVDAENDVLTYTSAGQQMEKSLLPTDEETGSENAGDTVAPEGDSEGENPPITNLMSIQDANLCDYTLWCDGAYNDYGEIQTRSGYFSTGKCYAVQGTAHYRVKLGDGRFRLLVNEYGADGLLISRTELASGAEHEMTASTEYVGLTMYMPIWKNMPMSELVTKLKYSLHTVEITLIEALVEEEISKPESVETVLPKEDEKDIVIEPEEGIKEDIVTEPENDIVTEPEEENKNEAVTAPEPEINEEVNTEAATPVTEQTPIQEVNLCDYTLWCDGEYNDYGVIQTRSGYFSTGECYGVQAGESYVFTLGDGRFRLLVNEYAADGRFVRRTELTSGAEHVMDGETAYVGLTMYMPAWPKMPMNELVTKLKYNLHKVVVTKG